MVGDRARSRLSASERRAFFAAHADKHRHNLRIACLLGVAAFAAFSLVDPFLVAGEALARVLAARVGIVGAIAVVFVATFFPPVMRVANLLTVAACLVIGGGVVAVTHLTGGGDSGYHQALLLTMLGFSSLIVWGPGPAGLSFATIILAYDLTLVGLGSVGRPEHFAANNAVLWAGAAIATFGVGVAQRLREIEFLRAQEIVAANQKLLALDAAKNAFFANVSHELRTPLMLIIAAIDSVHEQHISDVGLGQQVDIGRRNGLRLLRLVDDLLELSKLESDTLKLKLAPLDLGAFALDLAAQTRALAGRKGITVETDIATPLMIVADAHQIERVLLNLLANAIKFTGVGGTIRLRLAPKDGGVGCEVEDTGEGIPKEALPRIFERFYQAGGATRARRGGVGIGLSLCHRIVGLHGGRIEADSEVGRGTTLRFWLPTGDVALVPAPSVPATATSAPTRVADGALEKGMPEWDVQLREQADYRFFGIREVSDRRDMPRSTIKNDGPTVLAVDDNRDMVDFLISILGADHQVWAAGDGADGLALARRHRPDLIISDLVMPKMSGLDFLREVRRDTSLASIPFVLLTARGLASDRRDSDEGEADAFLPKPFLAGDLRPIVKRLLRRQDMQGQALEDANTLAMRMMAAGIAHDILNPVGFIQNAITILEGIFAEAFAVPGGPPTTGLKKEGEEFLRAAYEGVERVVAAVGELQRFARNETSAERRPLDIADAVRRVIATTRPHGVFTTALAARQQPLVRHGQLEQVLLNLVLNALQAGGNNCRIDISSRDDEAAGEVVIDVRDAGPGMDAETLSRIFTPYFTTKRSGTGLGLTMCRHILREHGGRLTVDSQPGRGTLFSLALPVAPSEAA